VNFDLVLTLVLINNKILVKKVMDFREKKDNPNPRENASLISKLFFLWIVPLFKAGAKKDLSTDDMYNVPREDISHKLGNQLGQ